MNSSSFSSREGVGVSLLTASLLLTEVTLTRIFSVTIWYHFAFLAISIALFGTGAAAILVHVLRTRLAAYRTSSLMAALCLAEGVVVIVSELVLLQASVDWGLRGAALYRPLTIIWIAAAAPFFCGGLALGVVTQRYSQHMHAIYFWDLAGASLGCLGALAALNWFGGPLALAVSAVLSMFAAALFWPPSRDGAASRRGLWPALAPLGMIILLATNWYTGLFAIRYAKGSKISDLHLEYNGWNSFSMVSVYPYQRFPGWGLSPAYRGPMIPQKGLVIDMNAMTTLLQFDGDFSKVSQLLYDGTAFAYRLKPNAGQVCVIGAGGGKDVLSALASGARHVTGIEVNPLIVNDVMRGVMREFTGGLYDRPDVTIRIGDGRDVVRSSDQKFDILQLSMVDTSAATSAGAYVLTENSLYTVEAFRDYLGHLYPGGILSVSSASAPTLAVGERLVTIARQALRSMGNSDPSASVLVISTRWISEGAATLYSVLIKPDGFSQAEIERARQEAERLQFRPVFLPGCAPTDDAQTQAPPTLDWKSGGKNDVAVWMSDVLHSRDDAEAAKTIDGLAMNVSPTTDDRPFFFYQNRLREFPRLLLGSLSDQALPFGNGLFILSKVLLIATVMVSLFIVLPLLLLKRRQCPTGASEPRDFAYTLALGIGFMAVEVAMVQKFSLYLGRPSDTLAIVLFVLLSCGALGTWMFGRGDHSEEVARRRLRAVLAFLVIYLLATWRFGLLDAALGVTADVPGRERVLRAVAVLAPLGLALGIPLPAGLSLVARRSPGRVTWLWGVNSATSVLGSVLATIVSMHAGISVAATVGAGLYAVAYVVIPRGQHTSTQGQAAPLRSPHVSPPS